jgi:hypothetical protein
MKRCLTGLDRFREPVDPNYSEAYDAWLGLPSGEDLCPVPRRRGN